jgi:hypothetical protein
MESKNQNARFDHPLGENTGLPCSLSSHIRCSKVMWSSAILVVGLCLLLSSFHGKIPLYMDDNRSFYNDTFLVLGFPSFPFICRILLFIFSLCLLHTTVNSQTLPCSVVEACVGPYENEMNVCCDAKLSPANNYGFEGSCALNTGYTITMKVSTTPFYPWAICGYGELSLSVTSTGYVSVDTCLAYLPPNEWDPHWGWEGYAYSACAGRSTFNVTCLY